MKIAHIISTFPPYKGGMGNSVYHEALQIGSRGHESVIFTPAYSSLKIGEETIGKNTTVVRLKPLLSIGNAAILPQLLWRLTDFDIVHLHYPFYGTAEIVFLAKLFFRGKLIVHYHMDTVGKGIKGIIFWLYSFFFLPLLVRTAAMITCASLDYIKQSQLADFYKTHEQMFIEIPFGVDTQQFYFEDSEREAIILFVGGLDTAHYFKGVEKLLEAFSKVVASHPKAQLILIGRGDLENYYINLAKKQGIEHNLKIINSASDLELAQYYRGAAVSVLPSINKSEAFGLVLLEAMASGTPVIASNLPGVRNVFRNKEQGFLIKPGDAGILAEKLCYILDHADKARIMGQAARKAVEEHYSWNKVGDRLEAAYYRILYVPKQPV